MLTLTRTHICNIHTHTHTQRQHVIAQMPQIDYVQWKINANKLEFIHISLCNSVKSPSARPSAPWDMLLNAFTILWVSYNWLFDCSLLCAYANACQMSNIGKWQSGLCSILQLCKSAISPMARVVGRIAHLGLSSLLAET